MSTHDTVPHNDDFDPNFHYDILCDGGCLNQGTTRASCYGSWRLRVVNKEPKFVRNKSFPEVETNNAAEYCAVIYSLRDLLGKITSAKDRSKSNPKLYSVLIRTDSRLVLGHLGFLSKNPWKCNPHHLQLLKAEAEKLIVQFGKVKMVKVHESFVKSILGH